MIANGTTIELEYDMASRSWQGVLKAPMIGGEGDDLVIHALYDDPGKAVAELVTVFGSQRLGEDDETKEQIGARLTAVVTEKVHEACLLPDDSALMILLDNRGHMAVYSNAAEEDWPRMLRSTAEKLEAKAAAARKPQED